MSEPMNPLKPVQSQTPSRSLGDDQDRHLDHQRTWLRRKPSVQRERRAFERRSEERRESERRQGERRTNDRRLGNRLGEERRMSDRRQGDRRHNDRRAEDRRSGRTQGVTQEATARGKTPEFPTRRKSIIDDYA